MAVDRQRWIGRIVYQVFEKFMVNQFVAWLPCLHEGSMIHKIYKSDSYGGSKVLISSGPKHYKLLLTGTA